MWIQTASTGNGRVPGQNAELRFDTLNKIHINWEYFHVAVSFRLAATLRPEM